jgi:pimeloyl-ACP methyl ester carboxylesterase
MRGRRVVVAFLLVAGAACGGGGGEASSTGTMAASASTSPSPEPTSTFPVLGERELLAMSEPVTVEAAGGVALDGRVFGSGDVGVVLSHMRPGDQGQWLPFAGLLADRGYHVLTYDRRGVCPGGDLGCSDGGGHDLRAWRDLASAVELLREEGSDRVVVGGASLGAMESLYALSHGLDADGLIWLSGLDLYEGESIEEQVRSVHVPKLFMTGAYDNDSAPLGSALERAAPEPVEIVSLDTGEHGTDILRFGDPVVADQIRQTVLDFLAGI